MATRNPERQAWHSMRSRCSNTRHPHFKHYGGRGIAVCEEWLLSFEAFLAHVGLRPSPEYTLDRIDNSRGYEPGNVRWATRKEQQANTRSARLITIGGVTKCLRAWSRDAGIGHSIFRYRLSAGWDPAVALSTPVNQRKAA